MPHLIEMLSHQEKRGSNQGWHVQTQWKSQQPALTICAHSKFLAFCTGEGRWCAPKSKAIFHELCRPITLCGSIFFFPQRNFWNTKQTKTLEVQAHEYFSIQVTLLELKNWVKLTPSVSYLSLTLNSTELTQGVARAASSGPGGVAPASRRASWGGYSIALEGSSCPPFWPLLEFLHSNVTLVSAGIEWIFLPVAAVFWI